MRLRKITSLFLALLLLCGMGLPALADEVTIAASVPDSHTITVSADVAEVFCNGQPGSRFTVGRLSEPTLLIRAESGRRITQICANGQDITDLVKGGYYTLPPVYEDVVLTVATEDEPAMQDRTFVLLGTVRRDGQPVADVTVELRSRLKTNATDEDGRFSFSDVVCGKHSLTALENGKIVGYLELLLTEGSTADIFLSNGVCTVTANRDEPGVHLTLNLAADGTMGITDVTGVPSEDNPGENNPGEDNPGENDPSKDNPGENNPSEDNPPGNNPDNGNSNGDNSDDEDASSIPKTGDTTTPLFWLVLMIVGSVGFAAMIFAYGRKGKTEE